MSDLLVKAKVVVLVAFVVQCKCGIDDNICTHMFLVLILSVYHNCYVYISLSIPDGDSYLYGRLQVLFGKSFRVDDIRSCGGQETTKG